MDFIYEAKGKDGKAHTGERGASSEAELIAWLRGNGWTPLSVRAKGDVRAKKDDDEAVPGRFSLDLSPKVKVKDKLIFFRQLATMINAGVPVASALGILADQTQNKRFRRILRRVHNRVNAGVTLGDALAEHKSCFDVLVISLVRAGEEAGTLDDSLVKIANFIEAQETLRKKIMSAMTYPSVVMSIALIVLGILCAVVIPSFEKAFANMKVDLPPITRATFAIGHAMQAYWYVPIIVIVGFILFVKMLLRVESLKYPLACASLKLPIFGNILFMSSITRAFRTMASLLNSGVPVLTTLDMSAEVALNEKIKRAFWAMKEGATMGRTLASVIQERKLFPPMIGHMIAVGEETGRTDEMVNKVADWYDAELSEKIKMLNSALEPVMVVFVGGIVGFIVFSVFMPIISSIQNYG